MLMTTNEPRRPRVGWTLAGAGLLLLAGLIIWRVFFAHEDGGDEEEGASEKEPATAQVRVASLTHGTIERTLTAYGTVVAAPGGARSVSFPFECRVVSVQASVGQLAAAGDALAQIEPSADARLALDSARATRDAADRALRDTQDRLKSRLATNQDLAAAEAAARDARLKFESLEGRGPGADGVVRAPVDGVVTRVAAQPGAVVAAGGSLLEIAAEDRLEARLGVAPPDAAGVQPGQGVHLFAVGGAELAGVVRGVGRSIDPTTRMVDAFVTLAPDAAPMLIGTFLRAEIVLETKEALLAPRGAVLPAGEGAAGGVLFAVEKDHAVKHEVKTGIDDGQNVEITSGAERLEAGASVVTQGNAELEDRMAVEVEPPEAAAPPAP